MLADDAGMHAGVDAGSEQELGMGGGGSCEQLLICTVGTVGMNFFLKSDVVNRNKLF